MIASRKRANRKRERGAAMVEAIVVMTTMLVFLGMNLWAVKAYGGKLDQASSTRRDAMFYATHSCEAGTPSDPDTYTDPALAGVRSGGAAAEGGGFGQRLKDAIAGAVGFGTSQVEKGDTTVSGSAIVNTTPQAGINLARVGLQATLKTSSMVGCNEKPYWNKWTALFQMGWGFLKSLVGR